MERKCWRLSDLRDRSEIALPHGGSLVFRRMRGGDGIEQPILVLGNGRLTFTVLPERGMDVGELTLDGEAMSWERDGRHLLHPDSVDLTADGGTGWLRGFYGAVASIGPELFGTPGEGYTLHGTASYSPAAADSVAVFCDDEGLTVEGVVDVRGYGRAPVFRKRIAMTAVWRSGALLRTETTENMSASPVTLDDGYHIQLSGPYLHEGGRYVLPAPARSLLLRDSAPPEPDPLEIVPRADGRAPIRCYQYVPAAVEGLEAVAELRRIVPRLRQRELGVTAEMLVNRAAAAAAYVVRPLSCWPRSLLAKEVGDAFMFALEPCRTRPNRMSQKHIDGEAFVLGPGERAVSECIIGVTRDPATIGDLTRRIERTAGARD